MKICGNCCYWSEMLAQALGDSPMEAMCLSETGPKASDYTTEHASCEAWKSNHHGAVDAPLNSGDIAPAAYEAEEAEHAP